ncbi:MAG: energy transducer TonB [Acidobacteriaceae bacterium]|nr:energy transducer TonB [Acidobacteriaceae bacterium]
MYRSCLCACVTLFALAGGLPAQETPGEAPYVSVGAATWFYVVSIPAVPNAPFSATTVMDNTQTLADGTTVTTKTMTTIARDSQGRTHNENRYYLTPSDNGQGRIRDITIFDPNTRTRTTLVPATMQATARVLPPKTAQSPLPVRPGIQREDLGISAIDGLTVHGYRQSRTIPAGADGNDQPITATDEYWYSDELHMNVTLKHSDPRHGTQVVTLTQLSRDEPDPKMFEVPPGYSVTNDSGVPQAVRIGAGVAAANLISQVQPAYPPLARAAGVQGSVEFTVLIADDGTVKNAQLVRGHPLLVNAAREAVLQWRYRSTLLDGKPISVSAPVTVTFSLDGQNR